MAWHTLLAHLQAALSGAVLLGGVIGIHELGHYLAARWGGLRVLSFSVGFGPALLQFERHGIRYALRLIPLGGYVNVDGEAQGAALDHAASNRPPATERRGCSYAEATVRQRTAYAAAGPLASLLLGFCLFAGCRWTMLGQWSGLPESLATGLQLVAAITAGVLHMLGATLWAVLCGAPLAGPSVGGVIAVSRIADSAAHHGLLPFLVMAGVVSVNLGIMNLLPIPILDGGALAMLLAERIRGRPLSQQVHFWLTAAGGCLVACVIVWSVKNDLAAQQALPGADTPRAVHALPATHALRTPAAAALGHRAP